MTDIIVQYVFWGFFVSMLIYFQGQAPRLIAEIIESITDITGRRY